MHALLFEESLKDRLAAVVAMGGRVDLEPRLPPPRMYSINALACARAFVYTDTVRAKKQKEAGHTRG